ncbi:hypothetical protein UB31_35500 [Bradyrhizobium sp. LTSP849]|nr:hypothetical protein UB31_35500 [Bradyrhizobium sp. LTSP849]
MSSRPQVLRNNLGARHGPVEISWRVERQRRANVAVCLYRIFFVVGGDDALRTSRDAGTIDAALGKFDPKITYNIFAGAFSAA